MTLSEWGIIALGEVKTPSREKKREKRLDGYPSYQPGLADMIVVNPQLPNFELNHFLISRL